MKTRNILGFLTLAAITAVTLGLAPREASPAAPSADNSSAFTVDPVHSSVIFKIKHMGVANFYGRFNDINGSFSIDDANPAQSQFNLEVKAESVDSKNSKRDGHLKSADFFNVAEYPAITFKSTKIEPKGEHQLAVTGDLTMHGVTKPITVAMEYVPGKQTPQGMRSGAETTFTIKRTDFGMDTYVANGALGDEVTIMVSLEAGRR